MSRDSSTSTVRDQREDEFDVFYARRNREVVRYFARATGIDRPTAEDLAQDTFMAAAVAHRCNRPEALSMPWLMIVARHKLMDHYRRVSREQRRISRFCRVHIPTDMPAGDDVDEVDDLISALPHAHRTILSLRYLHDLPIAAIADRLGRSPAATQSLLTRARASLSSQLVA